MDNSNCRKYLLSVIYKTIFKEIYQIDVGNAYHANRINQYSEQRRLKGYNYEDLAYLGLQIDSSADAFDFHYEISEGNFHNWMQGISNPKHLIMINSILEYLIDTCKDSGKYELLKSRILMILISPAFQQYTGDFIHPLIQSWISQIDSNNAAILYKATKEILYLLKSKEKFIPFLLKEQQELKSVTDVLTFDTPSAKEDPISDKADIPNPDSTISSFAILSKKIKGVPAPRKWFYLLSAGLLILLIFSVAASSFMKEDSISSPIYKTVDVYAPFSAPLELSQAEAQNIDDPDEPDTKELSPGTSTPSPSIYTSDNSEMKAESSSENATSAGKDNFVQDNTPTATKNGLAQKDASSITKNTIAKKEASSMLKNSSAQKESSSSTQDDSKHGNGSPTPTQKIDSILPPTILGPTDGSLLPASEITLRWASVPNATGYSITVTDTISWTTIYTVSNINDSSITLDPSLFTVGGHYRIYVCTENEKQLSAPNYIDITIDGLISPKITQPTNEAVYPLSDIDLQWEPVTSSTGYLVTITNTITWDYLLKDQSCEGNHFSLDRSLLLPGQSYRIYVSSVFDKVSSTPNYIDIKIAELPSPEFTTPKTGVVLSLRDIEFKWTAIPLATAYGITITDTVGWTNVYTLNDIHDTSIVLDASLLKSDRSYRIYVYSFYREVCSFPNYIDIEIQ